MKIIDFYLSEVRKSLFIKNKQEIIAELRTHIENELPINPTEDEVKSVLQKLGDPKKIAQSYTNNGGTLLSGIYFDYYKVVLALAIKLYLLVATIVVVINGLTNYDPSIYGIVELIFGSIYIYVSLLLSTFGFITLVFIMLERFDFNSEKIFDSLNIDSNIEWNIDDLIAKLLKAEKDYSYTLSEMITTIITLPIVTYISYIGMVYGSNLLTNNIALNQYNYYNANLSYILILILFFSCSLEVLKSLIKYYKKDNLNYLLCIQSIIAFWSILSSYLILIKYNIIFVPVAFVQYLNGFDIISFLFYITVIDSLFKLFFVIKSIIKNKNS